ncbi:MAG: CPBP family intramembrane metalloprotease [Deltaproteobacteria bacterium]|nr:CPBP family intramembrane metalloprotease [Deltaproteobacteria bacterium]
MPNRRILVLSVLFYLGLAAAALLWATLASRPLWLLEPRGGRPALLLAGLAGGVALGLLTVAMSRVSVARTAWGRELYVWFGNVLGPLGSGEAALLAALSSVGEELLFRGAMQPALGLVPTSLVFAGLHLPPRLALWPWTASAALLGLAMGLLAERTASLVGPVAAHFLINWLNLSHVGRLAREAQNLPAPDAAPSIDPDAPSMDRGAPARDVDDEPGGRAEP